MKRAVMMFFAMAIVAAALPSSAHEHATGIVKERMDAMERMAKRMKAINEHIDRKRDLAAIKADAQEIASQAPHIVHLFPPGSLQQPTEARNTIWQNWPDFERKAKVLENESQKLAGVSVADFAALEAQVRAVTSACGSCHENYRARKSKKRMR